MGQFDRRRECSLVSVLGTKLQGDTAGCTGPFVDVNLKKLRLLPNASEGAQLLQG